MADQEIRKACTALINLIKQGAIIYYDPTLLLVHRTCPHERNSNCWSDSVLNCKWREYCWVRRYLNNRFKTVDEKEREREAREREVKYLNHPAIRRVLLYLGLLKHKDD